MNKTTDIAGQCVKIPARRNSLPGWPESSLLRQEAKALEHYGLLGFWIGMMVVGGVPSAFKPLSFLTFNLTL